MARPKMILTADQVLTRKAMAWATKIRVNPTRIVIAELEAKWGSCALTASSPWLEISSTCPRSSRTTSSSMSYSTCATAPMGRHSQQ